MQNNINNTQYLRYVSDSVLQYAGRHVTTNTWDSNIPGILFLNSGFGSGIQPSVIFYNNIKNAEMTLRLIASNNPALAKTLTGDCIFYDRTFSSLKGGGRLRNVLQ